MSENDASNSLLRQTRRVFALLAIAGVLVACDGDGSGNGGTATSTPESSTTTTAADTAVVQVFFLDQDAFNIGRPPYVTPVERVVDASDPPRAALDELFQGPTPEEGGAGLVFIASEATGVADFRVTDGTAHVVLAGGCSSGGSTFTIAEEIVATLVQFPEVDSVKIYDPEGRTQSPDAPGDSIPECLEP